MFHVLEVWSQSTVQLSKFYPIGKMLCPKCGGSHASGGANGSTYLYIFIFRILTIFLKSEGDP